MTRVCGLRATYPSVYIRGVGNGGGAVRATQPSSGQIRKEEKSKVNISLVLSEGQSNTSGTDGLRRMFSN